MDRVCCLDVYKDSIFTCILTEKDKIVEVFLGTLTPELYHLRYLLASMALVY